MILHFKVTFRGKVSYMIISWVIMITHGKLFMAAGMILPRLTGA